MHGPTNIKKILFVYNKETNTNGGYRGNVPQICNLSSQMGGKSHAPVINVKTYPNTHQTRERARCNTAEKGKQTGKETIKTREHKEPCKYTSINSLCISDEEI